MIYLKSTSYSVEFLYWEAARVCLEVNCIMQSTLCLYGYLFAVFHRDLRDLFLFFSARMSELLSLILSTLD